MAYKKRKLKRKVKGTATPRQAAFTVDPETKIKTFAPMDEDMSFLELNNWTLGQIGGRHAYKEWVERNREIFYASIMPKTMPLQLTGAGGKPIIVEMIDPTQGTVYENEASPEVKTESSVAGIVDRQAVPGTAMAGNDREEPVKARVGHMAKKSRKRQDSGGDNVGQAHAKAGRVLAHAPDKRPGKKGRVGRD